MSWDGSTCCIHIAERYGLDICQARELFRNDRKHPSVVLSPLLCISAFSSYGESKSYVLSFRIMVFFYLVTTGCFFFTSAYYVRIQSINQSINEFFTAR